ncbi:RNA-directed DNA polymerase from mobile element jockey [Trichonephila clavipes]|nr:RNA-directed DNA polymerase from mobile element jockey [Trichonephila clavipes]
MLASLLGAGLIPEFEVEGGANMLLGNFILDYFRVVQTRRDFSRLGNVRTRCLRRAPTPVSRMSARVVRALHGRLELECAIFGRLGPCTLNTAGREVAHLRGVNPPLTSPPLRGSPSLDCPLTVSPHKSLNSSRGVISEPDLIFTPETEILEEFSGQGVIQVRRITIKKKKDAEIIPSKHLILTFNNPKLPTTIKAGYLNCKIRPYIPNPLRCFQCQRFGHSHTACRGQLTCSRCATVGHPSTDCTLEPKCVNCSQSHPSDSKLCSQWKTEKEIQIIKTNRNLTYLEARKLIAPQLSQSYAQVTKLSTTTTTTQTDENITKIVCPPLKLLQPLVSVPKPTISSSVAAVNTSSTSTQAELVPSTSLVTVASPSISQPPNSVIDTAPTTSNSLSISAASSSSQSVIPPPSDSYKVQDAKKLAKARSRKRKKELLKKMKEAIVDIKMNPHRPKKPASDESTSDEEEMIVYDVEDEIESNPDYVKENGKTYYKGQLLLTPTKHRK